jgi:hypothetical protein
MDPCVACLKEKEGNKKDVEKKKVLKKEVK